MRVVMTVEGSEANALLMREALARFSPSPEQRHYAWDALADEVKQARARIAELEAEAAEAAQALDEMDQMRGVVEALDEAEDHRKQLQGKLDATEAELAHMRDQWLSMLRLASMIHTPPGTGREERLLRRIAREAERLYEDGEYEDAADRIYAMTEPYRKDS